MAKENCAIEICDLFAPQQGMGNLANDTDFHKAIENDPYVGNLRSRNNNF